MISIQELSRDNVWIWSFWWRWAAQTTQMTTTPIGAELEARREQQRKAEALECEAIVTVVVVTTQSTSNGCVVIKNPRSEAT